MPDTTWVAGLDGCPAGWIAVLLDISGNQQPFVRLIDSISEIASLNRHPQIIAIDIPIGLPAHIGPGGRGCDVAARKVIGARQSSIFSVPARTAVMETNYAEACVKAAAHSTPSRKVSKQCFHLFPKIREVDRWIADHGHERIYECHPEVAFWAMNDKVPLNEPKKVKSQPCEPGMHRRRQLLERAGFPPELLTNHPWKKKDAAQDDLLDACAAAWTARRIASGTAIAFPTPPTTDDRGIPMTIWA